MLKKSVVLFVISMAVLGTVDLWAAPEEGRHICFRVVDADNDGAVTFEEFVRVYGDDKKTFDAVDMDKDGKLVHDEYHAFLGDGAS